MGYIYGPVPSRRLGRSLGIDLVPFKTCSYDCVYCQLGRTTAKSAERREWVPLDDILAQLETHLGSEPDYITLSGSGEPTLHNRLGELIARIKEITDVPVGVLTNGSLLWQPAVRDELLAADLVLPSLDAGDPATFQRINRPCPEVTFEGMLDGLVQFRQEHTGKYWLEVFLIPGYNAEGQALDDLARCARQIKPDRVQLNTATRPPAESDVVALSPTRMAEIASLFEPHAEVIADFRGVHEQREFAAGREEVLALLKRRPCSIDDIAGGLGMHRNEVVKYIDELSAAGAVAAVTVEGQRYYRAQGT